MRVFLINLDRDIKRLEWMKKQLAPVDLEFERFAARTGSSVENWQKPLFYKNDGSSHAPLKPGEIGCYASHLSIHKKIVDMPDDMAVLVLEDDLGITEYVPSLLKQIDSLPSDWDIVRLSNPPKSAYVPVGKLDGSLEVIRYWRVPNNTGAYLINKKGAQKFIDADDKRKRTIDEDMRRPWEHQMNTYGIAPAPFILNAFAGSSIDDIAQRTDLPWRKRSQETSPSAFLPMIRYKIKYFGVLGSLRCLAKNTTVSIGKRLGILDKDYKNYRIAQK